MFTGGRNCFSPGKIEKNRMSPDRGGLDVLMLVFEVSDLGRGNTIKTNNVDEQRSPLDEKQGGPTHGRRFLLYFIMSK
jgi:hypothetical protein